MTPSFEIGVCNVHTVRFFSTKTKGIATAAVQYFTVCRSEPY